MPRPEFTVEQAVSRFFPRSAEYDVVAARRLISWLDSCGYKIVEKTEVEVKAEPASVPRPRHQPVLEDA